MHGAIKTKNFIINDPTFSCLGKPVDYMSLITIPALCCLNHTNNYKSICDVRDILFIYLFYFPNGSYIDPLSLTYATNKGKTLKLQYR